MKILAFSDLHRDVEKAKTILEASSEADILVGAGDFATKGIGAHDTIDVLKLSKVPTLIVAGNHDNIGELRDLCSNWDNGFLLHGELKEFEGISFYGLGGEIPKRNGAEWNEALSEEDASEMLGNCPTNSVLVTHTPPFGCVDVQKDGTHEGSKAIKNVIENKQPMLNLCGHIHYSWGQSDQIGSTRIYNLGPSINWFEV